MFVINSECREGMAANIADNSIDAIVCDPPYGLSKQPDMSEVLKHWLAGDDYTHGGSGFMGKSWDSFVPGPTVWREALRCLKPGGYALVFAGARTQDLMTTSFRLAGFEIRDTIMWLYSTGFPKSLDVSKAVDGRLGATLKREVTGQRTTGLGTGGGHTRIMGDSDNKDITAAHTEEAKQWEGYGTAIKPAYEPIIICRKPLEGTVVDNVLKYGTGAINIEGCRVGGAGGRWPANIMHDGSDDVQDAFPDAKGQQGDLNKTGRPRPSRGVYSDMPEPNEHQARIDSDRSAARFFYCAKASKADRGAGLESFEVVQPHEITGRKKGSPGQDNPRAGIRAGARANHHPTVKPTELMRWLCRLVGHPGAMIMDPFAGSGSTGRGALLEGLNFVGFEMDPDYCKIADARILDAMTQAIGP